MPNFPENTIFTTDISTIRKTYEKELRNKMDILYPKLRKAYTILKKKNHIYDIKKGKMANLKKCKSFGDADYYASIVDPKFFIHNNKALYIHAENAQWIIQFIDTPFIDQWKNKHEKGITIHKVFSAVDINCIEKAWNCNNIEQYVTKADLIVQTFTDVTKYSQKLGSNKTACHRPTINRVIQNHNNKEDGGGYYPVFTTSSRYFSSDFGDIEYCFYYMIMVCNNLNIAGAIM